MKTQIEVKHQNGKTYSYKSNIIPTVGSWFVAWEKQGKYGKNNKIIEGRVYDISYVHLKYDYDSYKDIYLDEGTDAIILIKDGEQSR